MHLIVIFAPIILSCELHLCKDDFWVHEKSSNDTMLHFTCSEKMLLLVL